MRGDTIRYFPNTITAFRLILGVMLVFADSFSLLFWILYLVGGLSDVLDGFVARKFKLQTDFGAKFDSIADAVYIFAVIFVAVKVVTFPVWLYVCTAIILVVRLMAYGIGYYKYRTFSAVHTYMNKLTGLLLFAFPALYISLGADISGGAVIAVASVSAIEELFITIKSKKLDPDCKTIFL